MTETARLKLPLLAAAQAQKHVTHNEALVALDTLCQAAVLDKDLATPPGSPSEGDIYIVAGSATGAWSGWENRIVRFIDGQWRSYSPGEGWFVYVRDEDALYTFDGSAWNAFGVDVSVLDDLEDVDAPAPNDGDVLTWDDGSGMWIAAEPSGGGGGGGLDAVEDDTAPKLGGDLDAQTHDIANVGKLGIGATPDATNRLAVASPAILFNRETDDIQVKLNKESAGDDAAFIFQHGFSTRGLIGLLGDDDFTFKVSPDGSAFHTGFTLDRNTGNAAFAGALSLAGDPSSALQAATKQYVDGLAANLGKRARVRAATTANITISTALNNGDTLDGVTLATGDWVLVKDQSTGAQNGIYEVAASPARISEFDTYNEHPGSLIAVAEGTANADTLWLCTSNAGGTLNSTAIAFSKLVIAGELLAANNLSDVANTATARSNLGATTFSDVMAAASWNNLAESGGDLTMDCASGTKLSWKRTLTGAETLLAPLNLPDGVTVNVIIDPDGNPLAWDTEFVFPDDEPHDPTTKTMFSITRDGSDFIALKAGDNLS